MDRDVLDVIEREIDQEARARFPGTAVRQTVLLQYGDDPRIKPRDLWVRVLLDADGPEDYEPTLAAFRQAVSETAGEQFADYLAAMLAEIRLVEYTFSNNPVTRDGHGPRVSNLVGDRRGGLGRAGPAGRPNLHQHLGRGSRMGALGIRHVCLRAGLRETVRAGRGPSSVRQLLIEVPEGAERGGHPMGKRVAGLRGRHCNHLHLYWERPGAGRAVLGSGTETDHAEPCDLHLCPD
jgi:hypothetical protein